MRRPTEVHAEDQARAPSPREPYGNGSVNGNGYGHGLGLGQSSKPPGHDGMDRSVSQVSNYADHTGRQPLEVPPIREEHSQDSTHRSRPRSPDDDQSVQRDLSVKSPERPPRREPLAPPIAPTITTTQPSPLIPDAPQMQPVTEEKTLKRRVSFHPPPLDTAFSREVLLTSRSGVLPGAGLTVAATEDGEDAIMANVEELLEGFDWTATSSADRGKKGADAIEARLLDELAALDNANIHAFLESDDRIAQVLAHVDEALAELEDIDMQITGYKMQLNVSNALGKRESD
jgi:hypothetical protein